MFVSVKLFAALLAVIATGVTGYPAELEERDSSDSPYPYVCTDSDFGGVCNFLDIGVGSGCYGLGSTYYDTISSINPYGKAYILYA
jgi:hypothetical protein